MEQDDFLSLWDRQLAPWCAEDLMREGHEAALLMPLAPYAVAAERLVKHAFQSEDYRYRKLAAILAGFTEAPAPGILDELFEAESERNALAAPESLEPLCCQSVVEDIVLAASRWCRRDALRAPAMELLKKIVGRTLIGEYWSTACYGLVTLCRYDHDGTEELVRAFREFAYAAPPDHPSHPRLGTEREFVKGLIAGWRETYDAIEAILDRQEAVAQAVQFEAETQALVSAWIESARRLGV